jgi:hypothetical protein
MKKLLTCLVFAILSLSVFAQNEYISTYKFFKTQNIHNQLRLNTKTGEVIQMQDDGQEFVLNYGYTPENKTFRYWLYETKNMWTFILLDTFTGKLWQCQYSVEGVDYIFTIPINEWALVDGTTSRFSIEPMTSMYQYYLIDNETGEMWKFQWSTKGDDYRWIEKYR